MTFEIEGNYTTSGITWLKVYNQKSEVVAYHLIKSFPTKAILPDYGQYTSFFEGLTLNSTAVIKVSSISPVIEKTQPFSGLSNIATIATIIGVIVFAVGFKLELFGQIQTR